MFVTSSSHTKIKTLHVIIVGHLQGSSYKFSSWPIKLYVFSYTQDYERLLS
jgi:hypothetical protein